MKITAESRGKSDIHTCPKKEGRKRKEMCSGIKQFLKIYMRILELF